MEFIAEHFMKCSFITTEKKIVRSKRRGVFIFLLLTGIVYITFLASSPQWSLKMHRYVILLANTYWTNYRKTLVDTCKKLSNATRRAVMGLGKEETPPPRPLPCTSTLPWPLSVGDPQPLLSSARRGPYALPFPSFSSSATHVDVTQISLQKILFFWRQGEFLSDGGGGSPAKQMLGNCHSLPVASIHIWDDNLNSVYTTCGPNAARVLWMFWQYYK